MILFAIVAVLFYSYQNCQNTLKITNQESGQNIFSPTPNPSVISPTPPVISPTPSLVITGGKLNLPFPSDSLSPNLEGKTWGGPQALIVYLENKPFLKINLNNGERILPFVMPAVVFNSDVNVISQQMQNAKNNGFDLVEVVSPNNLESGEGSLQFYEQYARNLDMYLIWRYSSDNSELLYPDSPSPPVPPEESALFPFPIISNGIDFLLAKRKNYVSNSIGWVPSNYYQTLNLNWLQKQKKHLDTLIKSAIQVNLDKRIIGFFPTYLAGGEWFSDLYYIKNDGSIEKGLVYNKTESNGSVTEYASWKNPEKFYIGDYRTSEKELYQNWRGLMNLPLPNSDLPTFQQRSSPAFKRTLLSSEGNSNESNGVHFRRFQSERVLWLLDEISYHIKQATQNKALVGTFYGYLFILNFTGGSYHTALDKMFQSPNIDFVASPYLYSESREPGFAFLNQGPYSAARLNGKAWLIEDDSRPYWESGNYFTKTLSQEEDFTMLRRNMSTSWFNGAAIYYLDLIGAGWFKKPEVWTSIRETYQILRNANFSGVIQPEIAVIIDSDSMNYQSEFGIHMNSSASQRDGWDLHKKLTDQLLNEVSRLGAPVRYYLFSDAIRCPVELQSKKFIVFLNTWKVTSEKRNSLKSCFFKEGKSLLFQYAAGIYKDNDVASAENMSDLIGQNVQFSSSQDFTVTGQVLSSNPQSVVTVSTGGNQYRIYYFNGYNNSSGSTMRNLLVEMASAARVHLWTRPGIVVDGQGDLLMIHYGRNTNANGNSIQVNFPQALDIVEAHLSDGAVVSANNSLKIDIAVDSNTRTRIFKVSRSAGTNSH